MAAVEEQGLQPRLLQVGPEVFLSVFTLALLLLPYHVVPSKWFPQSKEGFCK